LLHIYSSLQTHPESREISAGIATGYELDGRVSSPSRDKILLFYILSRPVMGPTQPSIKWVLGVLSLGVKARGVKLTSHLLLESRLRMKELYLHPPRLQAMVLY
jgi:hypothetical protein